jgi:cell division protein ZapB
MVNELNALESKIAQAAALCRSLRAENSLLRQQLSSAEAEKTALTERIDSARTRLEQLALQLPEAKDSL